MSRRVIGVHEQTVCVTQRERATPYLSVSIRTPSPHPLNPFERIPCGRERGISGITPFPFEDHRAMAALAGSGSGAGVASVTGAARCPSTKQRAMPLSSSVSLRGDFASSLTRARGARKISTPGRRPFQVLAMAPPKPAGKAKKVVGIVKLALEAGKATPAPPVGPALGSKGVNIMAFCKEYNAKTADKPGYVIPVEITVFDDKSFTFILKTPPASILLLKACGAAKGSNNPQKEKVGTVTVDQVRVIAQEKLQDLNCTTIESAMRIIAGTAANMGIDVDPPILVKKEKILL